MKKFAETCGSGAASSKGPMEEDNLKNYINEKNPT
jgi:hypothetical protein